MTRAQHRTIGTLAAIIGALVLSATAVAQEPDAVPREFIDDRRRIHATELRYCIDQTSPMASVHRDVAHELSAVLLIEPVFVELPITDDVRRVDGMPIDFEDLYILMMNACDAFLGRTLSGHGWPDWLTFSMPYMRERYVAVTTMRTDGVQSLADLPLDRRRVGALIASRGDGRLVDFIRTRQARESWTRVPLVSLDLVWIFLAGERIDAAVVPEHAALRWIEEDALARLSIVDVSPMRPVEFDVGIALLSRETYLRTFLDEGIRALLADGIVSDVLARHGIGGIPTVR